MSNLFVAIRDGGKTSEEGFTRLINKLAGTLNKGVVSTSDFAVSQHGTPNMSVDLTTGDILIPYQTYVFHGWSTALQTVTIAASDPSNGRISRVVAYIDLSVVASVTANNPDAIKLKEVAGTASGSPVRPSDATVQASVGAGNPFVDLADVAVDATVTTIVNSKITDKRARFIMGGSGAMPSFSVAGTAVIQNGGFMPNWIVPPGVAVINRLAAIALTGPVGSALTLRLWNVTTGLSVGSVSIPAGSRKASSTTMDNAAVSTDDEIRFDITAVGSTTPGSDVLLQPSV